MKKIIAFMMAVSVFAPLSTSAVVINTSASSHTGGFTAGQGEDIVTGSSESSSNIKTTIISDENGGTADVQITNSQNGVQNVEKKHYDIPAGGAVEIHIATTSSIRTKAYATSTTRMVSSTSAAGANGTSSTSTLLTRSLPGNAFRSWLNWAPQSLASFLGRFLSLFSR